MKRMRLITEEDFDKIKQLKIADDQVSSINQQQDYVSQLENQSLATLLSNLDTDIKLKLFQTIQQRLDHEKMVKDKKPFKVEVTNSSIDSIPILNVTSRTELPPGMNYIPPRFLDKMKSVIEYLKKNSSTIIWNKQGEVTIKGQAFPKSNITDLLNTTVRGLKSHSQLVGHKEFLNLLGEINLPKTLLAKGSQKALQRRVIQEEHIPPYEDISTLYESPSSELPIMSSTPAPVTGEATPRSTKSVLQAGADAIKDRFVNMRRGANSKKWINFN